MSTNDLLRQELSPAVVVAIGGKEYSLVYDLQAAILYKEKTKQSLFQEDAFSKINPVNDPGLFAACLWAGLQRKHSDVTLEWLCEAIPFGPAVNPIIVALSKALTAHFPKTKDKSPNVAAPAADPEKSPAAQSESEATKLPTSAPSPVSISA